MRIKKTISDHLPKSLIYARKYWLNKKNANKTYSNIEKELDERFEKVFGRHINWESPMTYNEKINVTKVYGATPTKARLSDKIAATEWVKEKIGDDGCNFIPLLAVYDSIEDIDFNSLPKRFVMKMNNDSGSVYIYDGNSPIDKKVLKKYKYYYQRRNYAYSCYEMQYKDIKPKIMIEKYMGKAIRDYKFQCFNGKCYSCRVDFNRFGEHTRNFYDKNWNLLPYNKGDYSNYPTMIKKPKNLEKMWRMAEKLSSGFDQVRVDFYDIDNVVYFGEMTFTNGAGFEKFYPDEIDIKMGKLWELDLKNIKKLRAELLESKRTIRR